MSKNLVIVESPAKAKTIEKFLGKDFQVESSFGHVRDLVKENFGVDIENNFEPKYQVSKDKKDQVKKLKKLASDSEMIWLASDEDREGEAISWHLKEVLDLQEDKLKRIVFHEITKPAIQKAIQNPRGIDYDLVNAQQARRILDRLVGFKLSPVLWKKIKANLSAGRVQSVAVRLIVEKERSIEKFEPKASFKVAAHFYCDEKKKTILKATLAKGFETEQNALDFLEKCKNAIYKIKSLETKDAKKSPAAPFTTSTLQQEASRKLSFSVSKTMMVAQKLYEAGKITYMRTDSVNLSDLALEAAKTEIEKAYGKNYAFQRKYKTKSSGAQEAHEAIRPTYFENHTTEGTRDEQVLYELIWKRAIASQMSDAKLEKTTAKIEISTASQELVAHGEVLKFDGFLKVYLESKDEDEEDDTYGNILPPLTVGQILDLIELTATERFSRPPARFTEASLVKKLEELGIGRPSTYAPTISTIQKRGYVEKTFKEGKERKYRVFTLKNQQVNKLVKTEIHGAEKAKLFPTDIGKLVNDYLVEHFTKILDYNFTANVEKDFDEIATGKKVWQNMLSEFYNPFHKNVEEVLEKGERVSGERILGIDPKSGKQVSVRIARYGPVAMKTDLEDEEVKAEFASLLKTQNLETITFEEALDLFRLPRTLGDFEEKPVSAAIGRFGPYVKHDNKFVSLGKELDPYTVTLEEAIPLILEKREKDANKYIKTFEAEGRADVEVLNGRYGPYIKIGRQNIKIPKDKEPKDLTLEECLELQKNAPKGKRKAKK